MEPKIVPCPSCGLMVEEIVVITELSPDGVTLRRCDHCDSPSPP